MRVFIASCASCIFVEILKLWDQYNQVRNKPLQERFILLIGSATERSKRHTYLLPYFNVVPWTFYFRVLVHFIFWQCCGVIFFPQSLYDNNYRQYDDINRNSKLVVIQSLLHKTETILKDKDPTVSRDDTREKLNVWLLSWNIRNIQDPRGYKK